MSDSISEILQNIPLYIEYFYQWARSGSVPLGELYIQIVRFFMPILALLIVLSVIRHMMRVRNPRETWGYLISDELGRFTINHWECTIGRANHCDIVVRFATISRTQCALMRDDDGQWYVHDLGNRRSTTVNDQLVTKKTPIGFDDVLSIGGIRFTFQPLSAAEHEAMKKKRISRSKPIPPWTSMVLLTLFQGLTVTEFMLTRTENFSSIASCFILFSIAMWAYTIITRLLGQTGFEPEILAFFACTLNLAVTATSDAGSMFKETVAILMGMGFFVFLGWYLRDIDRVKDSRKIAAGMTVALFAINLVFGVTKFGAANWIRIGGMSLQPSEIAKVLFIFAGAATLDRLFVKRNLFGFMMLSGVCLGSLAIMGDFGTASIFFIVFLVIAFLRSGDFATLSLITGAAAGAALMVIRFKPYVAARFTSWGHAWEHVNESGYQQVRAMSASASGGMIGVGAGNGWLHNVAASNTDLVLGIICEEWGLIIGLIAIMIIITLSIFAFRVVQPGRSSYYTIAACAATSLFVFQTILNVFGSVDLLPLTGVTFPFISCGGSSMLSSWGLLAFLKAADTRQNASFAVRNRIALGQVPLRPKKKEPLIPPLPEEPEEEYVPSYSSRSRYEEEEADSKGISDFWTLEADDNEDEIDVFLRSFDDIDPIPDRKQKEFFTDMPAMTEAEQEIDDFLSLFDDIEPVESDWRIDE